MSKVSKFEKSQSGDVLSFVAVEESFNGSINRVLYSGNERGTAEKFAKMIQPGTGNVNAVQAWADRFQLEHYYPSKSSKAENPARAEKAEKSESADVAKDKK